MNRTNFYDTVNQIITYGVEKNILHLHTSPVAFNSMEIHIDNKPVINFGSCSYLGLEFHPLLKQAACDAIQQSGTQFAASRAYLSLHLYKKLEEQLQQIFQAPLVIVPTTTLGHIACIPVVITDSSAVIMDHQLHNSVQTAVQLVKAHGVHTELVRHNRIDLVEEKIKSLRNKYRTIWYMADGIYSMFGDGCPVDEVYRLLDIYPELHFYVDDAHGMGIYGSKGQGYVLNNRNIHPKMILATSLNKAFASGGGLLVFGDNALAEKVANTGGPLLSSGPMQPGALGAAIAAAGILLSDELALFQQELQKNIHFARILLSKYKLPVVSEPGAAIFFVPVSLPKSGHQVVRKMLDAGFYVNLGIFPTVPMKQTGIRFTVTRLHTFEQLEKMIGTLSSIFYEVIKEHGITLYEIYKAFRMPLPCEVKEVSTIKDMVRRASTLDTKLCGSITEIYKAEWDALFSGKGNFDYEGMLLLENTFTANVQSVDSWHFDYLIIKDEQSNIVAATFFTTASWKDDMLSPHEVSQQVEAMRENDPLYLTSKTVCCGSLFSEGEHLYINMSSPQWKEALHIVFETAYALQEKYKAVQVVLRDFHKIYPELDALMVDNGFFRIQMPDSYTIKQLDNLEVFIKNLSYNAKRQLKKKVLRHTDNFIVTIHSHYSNPAKEKEWYGLYLNVKNKNLSLNTFALPFTLFHHICQHPDWEVMELTLKNPDSMPKEQLCAVIFCHKAGMAYIPMVIGIEYRYNGEYNVYRQALYQVVLRAFQLGKQRIQLGFSAGMEKQKMGATPTNAYAYIHNTDSYNAQAIASLSMLIEKSN